MLYNNISDILNLNYINNIYNTDYDEYKNIILKRKDELNTFSEQNSSSTNIDSDNEDISSIFNNKCALVTGLPRLNNKCIKSWEKLGNNIDYYLCFWDITGNWKINKKNYNLSYSNDYNSTNIISSNILYDFIKLLNPVSIKLLNYKIFNIYLKYLFKKLKKYDFYGGPQYIKCLIHQYYILFNGYNQILDIEYSYFIRLRTDLHIFNIDIDLTSDNILYVPNHPVSFIYNNNNIYINDIFMITKNKDYFKKYCCFFNNIENIVDLISKIKNIDNNILNKKINFHNEALLGFYLIEIKKIKIKYLDLKIGLIREDHYKIYENNKINHIYDISNFKE